MLEIITQKKCCRCKEIKPLTDFYKDKNRKSGYTNECKSCRKVAQQRWQKANPEKTREQARKWRKANPEKFSNIQKAWRALRPEKVKENFQKWYGANREKELERKRKYHAENREKEREYDRLYRQENKGQIREKSHHRYEKNRWWFQKRYIENKEEILERNRQWAKANPDKVRVKSQNRRAKVKKGGGRITGTEWRDLKEKYNHACLCCGRREPEIKLTLDHVNPLDNGGTNHISNIQPLCLSCNDRKGTKIIDYR